MATLLLSAAGSAIGGAAGGSLAGLSTLALGKAVGATLGSAIDQRLMGQGAAPVETGRVDRFRVMGSGEGAVLPRVFGRMRVAGQIIWSSRFLESVNESSAGGKATGGATIREFSYLVSLAIALCEGEVLRIGRIWADGQPIEQRGLTCRLHPGSESQLADPLISAIEGVENAPAYRGTAYVVFENLDLSPFGNRIPQFNFEVFRRPDVGEAEVARSAAPDVRGVALVPGTGEYSLATEPVFLDRGKGDFLVLNVNNDRGIPDLVASLDQLDAEVPNARSIALVVSWFGDDLRCGRCRLRPAVEQSGQDGAPIAWSVSGQRRVEAAVVSRVDGRPLFGGTPADATVLQGIARIKSTGHSAMFYPFILMDITAGNGLTDPWTGKAEQPPVPWRGRITLSLAAGESGSPDKTASAASEVAGFFGAAKASDFRIDGETVVYTGPAEWSYRRFILHYAHLCVLAGGVDAFCIGSEMRGLTQIRDGAGSYAAVRSLCRLAEDVRGILGRGTKVGYAADWSEYFGHHPSDGTGDVFFNLDPLWAHPEIDFIGIDNYMPLSDWRDGLDHADAAAGSIYDLDYLRRNVAGGEGFDWYYSNAAARDRQLRQPVQDGAYGEHWLFRYKDLVNWWSRRHTDRPAGTKAGNPTAWRPRSKPIWFTELGCPAVDKGTNQPNVFFDPKSSESFFPYYSNGTRDDFIQHRYLQAMYAHWNDPANNPRSDVYGGSMVDMSRAHVWAWDARPWPDFPDRLDMWSDGRNYDRGHWLNGRASLCSLAEVVAEVCTRAGLVELDVAALHGGVTGYSIGAVETARQSLQPLMLAYGFDSFSNAGDVAFENRSGRVIADLSPERMVASDGEAVVVRTRGPAAETAGRMTLGFVQASADYQSGAAEAVASDQAEPHTAQTGMPLVLHESEAQAIVSRWLHEGRIARDSISFALPQSLLRLTAGDTVAVDSEAGRDLFRIDRVEETLCRKITAVRVEPGVYSVPIYREPLVRSRPVVAPTPVHAEFLDLPMLTGDEAPHAPRLAVIKRPWTGPVAVFGSSEDHGYTRIGEVRRPATLGETLHALPRGEAGVWSEVSLRVRIVSGQLQSRTEIEVLNGANIAALRFAAEEDWEVIQFRDAELVAPREYRLKGLLRGQAGTDGIVPATWPTGTDFVLLDGAVVQLDVPASARGLDRHYRIGPATRSYAHPSYVHMVARNDGVGLRPYRPAHLRAKRLADGGIEIAWTRRSRIDGDSWQGAEVPLGEDRETYVVRILGNTLLREFEPARPIQHYSAAEQATDGAPARLIFEVAQLSDRFGPGPFERIVFDG